MGFVDALSAGDHKPTFEKFKLVEQNKKSNMSSSSENSNFSRTSCQDINAFRYLQFSKFNEKHIPDQNNCQKSDR
jgi:hypothetical protein